jgi:hypothetical protein
MLIIEFEYGADKRKYIELDLSVMEVVSERAA